jgi:signal transduction histidine kinase
LEAESDERGLTIQVSDSGWGIEKEYISHIFDMYFRAHERSKGNGLGLYIVKKITEKLNGTIELQSTVGKGTTVKVFFPHKISQSAVS